MPYREYVADLRRCQEVVFEHTGVRPQLHRPPLGELSMAALFAPKKCDLVTVNWTCSAEDWRFRSDCAATARAEEMVNEIKARDVILFHDEQSHTVVALDHLLPALTLRGLQLSPSLENIL